MMGAVAEPSPVILDRGGSFASGMVIPEYAQGGFFDDDMMPRSGRGDIRAHLDDLAQRHPEFAAQLRGPAWGSEMWTGDDGGAAASSASESHQEQEQSDEPGPLRGRPRNNLPQHGLRNTVPDMGQRQAEELKEEARGQRSWSAPPDSRLPKEQQRFVSRININPVNPDDPAAGDGAQQPQPSQAADNLGKPPPVPKQQQQQPQQQSQQTQQSKPASNVRHIPIFVEGRDEPILPKNLDTETEPSYQQHFTSQAQHQFPPQSRPFPQQKRPFQSPQSNPPQHKQPNRSFNASPKPFQQSSMHSNFPQQQSGTFPQPQQQYQQPQQQQQHQQPPQQANVPTDPRPKTPEPPKPKVANDPISRVQAIQKEVAALREQVQKYSGNSRQEKEYIYLDEMLTRNLIKLDDIETEGKENIRVARKDAIRSIQQCINILEGKVPLPQEQEQPMEEAESSAAKTDCPVEDPSTGACEATGDQAKPASAESDPMETAVENNATAVEMPMDVEEKRESAEKPESQSEKTGSSNTTEQTSTTMEGNGATPAKTDEEKPKD